MNDKSLSRFHFGLNRIFYGWWIVLASFLLSLYSGAIIFYGFTAFFDPLIKEFGWSHTEVSFAVSLRGIEMSLLSPLVGFLVDRYGSLKLTLWGVIAIGLGFLTLSLTRSLWMFYVSIILIAFGGGGCTLVVFNRVISNWFQKKIGLALGIVTSGFGASGLLIPVIVWLIDDFGWRTAVIILGVGMWLIGIPLTFVIRDTPEQYGQRPDGLKTEPALKVKSGEMDCDAGEVPFREALKDKAFLLLALSEGLRMMVLAAVVTHIMPYLNLLHIPRTTAGMIAGAIAVLSIIGRFGFGWLSDHFDKRYIIAISFGLMSLGMFALCYVDSWWVMAVFLLLFPAGFGGGIPLRGAILLEYFGRKAFGRLLGTVMGASAIGGMIGPTLAGFIFDTTGAYYFTWLAFGIISCLTVVLMLHIGPNKKVA